MNTENKSPAEMRVLIANDVISSIKKGRAIATEGIWLGIDQRDENGECAIFDKTDVKNKTCLSEILSKFEKCNVCAVGAVFLAAIERFNSLTCDKIKESRFADEIWFSDMEKFLLQYFEKDQIILIEMAFEGGAGGLERFDLTDAFLNNEENDKKIELAEDYAIFLEDPTDRLLNIMQNIIKNNGEFIPKRLRLRKV